MLDRAENADDDGHDAFARRTARSSTISSNTSSRLLAVVQCARSCARPRGCPARARSLRTVLVRCAIGRRFSEHRRIAAEDRDAASTRRCAAHIDELSSTSKSSNTKQQLVRAARVEEKAEEWRDKFPRECSAPAKGRRRGGEEEEPPSRNPLQDQAAGCEQRGITPEMAQQILEALRLNGDRKLPLGAMKKRVPGPKGERLVK